MPGKSSVIPELDDVYRKWEQRGPRAAGGAQTGDQGVVSRADRAVAAGKQRWKDKFGDNVQPVARRQSRDRRKVVALSAETIRVNTIAQFKSQPTVKPEQFVSVRPFMGQCCSCLPNSQKDLMSSTTRSEGMRNLMDYRHAMRGSGPLARQFPILAYVLQRRTNHVYPDLTMAVLTHPRVVEAIQQELMIEDVKLSQSKLEKKARAMLKVMKSVISNALTKLAAWSFMHLMSYLNIGIQIHKGQIKMIETAHKRGLPIVYLPLHKSHLDYILITHCLWNYNLRNPYIAAGDNLNIFFFNSVMRGLGGFFIRRKLDSGSKKDAIYRAVLHSYLEQLLMAGQSIEFFLEGGRSRTGKALQPKGGLLSVVIDSLNTGVVEDALLVPVSISYEKILDGNYTSEQMGIPKKRETFLGALWGIWSMFCKRYGSLRVDFAQPFSLRECMQTNQPQLVPSGSPESSSSELSFSTSPPGRPLCRESSMSSLYGTDLVEESQRQTVNRVGQHVVYTCVQTTSLMSTNLLAFLLLTKHRQGATASVLENDFVWLREQVLNRRRDVGFAPTSKVQDVLRYAARLLGESNIQIRPCEDGNEDMFVPCVDIPNVFELSYYGNSVISVFLLESILVNAVIYLSDVHLGSLDISGPTELMVISKTEILEAASQLCTLLDHEFIFVPPCRSLEEALTDTLDSLVTSELLKLEESQQFDSYQGTLDKQWATRLCDSLSWAEEGEEEEAGYRQEDLYTVNIERTDCRERLRFFHGVLAPILEAYLVTVHQISENLVEEIPEDDFLKQLHCYAKDRVIQGVASYGESAALETLKMALKRYKTLKLVDSYRVDNLVMLGLRNRFDTKEKLNLHLQMLGALRT